MAGGYGLLVAKDAEDALDSMLPRFGYMRFRDYLRGLFSLAVVEAAQDRNLAAVE
jgi:hypothetical protein